MTTTNEGSAESADPATQQVIIVANRLPIERVEHEDGTFEWQTSPGGLVSAVKPAMHNQNLTWVGWAGGAGDHTPPTVDGIQMIPVALSETELTNHYDGMSNGTLWPLYHDRAGPVEFHRTWFDGYRQVNEKFANAVANAAEKGAVVWVHDYQLQLVPGMLRELRPDLRIGFFIHIPFPPSELFIQLPWRLAITKGILGSDLIGFQTPSGAANFGRVASELGVAVRDGRTRLQLEDRSVEIGAFPIGIDVERYEGAARDVEIEDRARDLRARLGQPQTVLLGVDRLDYTKGIDVRLRAFMELLAEGRLRSSHVTMIQVAQPSRDNVDAYINLRGRVEQLVGEINGDHGRVGFPVVHYIHQTQNFIELMSLYRAADVMLVTPFADGMNLVAKEYVATRYDDTGALVLSQFAGTAQELTDALVVNPYDLNAMKDAIATAVDMPHTEKQKRMQALREAVSGNTASDWAAGFLERLGAG